MPKMLINATTTQCAALVPLDTPSFNISIAATRKPHVRRIACWAGENSARLRSTLKSATRTQRAALAPLAIRTISICRVATRKPRVWLTTLLGGGSFVRHRLSKKRRSFPESATMMMCAALAPLVIRTINISLVVTQKPRVQLTKILDGASSARQMRQNIPRGMLGMFCRSIPKPPAMILPYDVLELRDMRQWSGKGAAIWRMSALKILRSDGVASASARRATRLCLHQLQLRRVPANAKRRGVISSSHVLRRPMQHLPRLRRADHP